MPLNRNRILRFIGFTVLWFILICIIWYLLIGPVYNDILAATSDGLMTKYSIWHTNDLIYVLHEDYSHYVVQAPEKIPRIFALDIQYGLILLLALIFATPGIKLIQRLKYIPITVVVMFVIHILGILIFAWSSLSSNTNPLGVLFSILGSALFPIVIWGILSFKYFLPRLQEASAERMSARPRGKKRWELRR